MSALNKQVGGTHYKDQAIQPVEYIYANNVGYFEGNVIKYVTRWRDKNGIADLEKAKHYLELLIELEGKNIATKTIKMEKLSGFLTARTAQGGVGQAGPAVTVGGGKWDSCGK